MPLSKPILMTADSEATRRDSAGRSVFSLYPTCYFPAIISNGGMYVGRRPCPLLFAAQIPMTEASPPMTTSTAIDLLHLRGNTVACNANPRLMCTP